MNSWSGVKEDVKLIAPQRYARDVRPFLWARVGQEGSLLSAEQLIAPNPTRTPGNTQLSTEVREMCRTLPDFPSVRADLLHLTIARRQR